MKIIFPLLFIMLLTTWSCNSDETATTNAEEVENIEIHTGTLADIQWMAGRWLDTVTFGYREPPIYMMDVWVAYEDSLSGKGLSVRDGDTTEQDLLVFRMINNTLTLVVTPVGIPVLSYKCVNVLEKQITFENKANDYPQQITYRSISDDSISIEFEGISNNIERKVLFKYRRVE